MEDKIGAVIENICMNYCKYPVIWDEEKEGVELSESDICRNCPLDELEVVADVPDRNVGRWIEKGKTPGYKKWKCSNCGSTFKNSEKPWYSFCPNCGTKMEASE